MLAVQLVHLYWEKDSRTPQGAVQRREYLHPYKIPADADLSGKGELFFLKCCFYQRNGHEILTPKEFLTDNAKRYNTQSSFSEMQLKAWKRVAEAERQAKGIYMESVADCGIKGIDITRCGDSFEIQFYSLGEEGLYVPPRFGKNVLYPTVQLQGKTLKRETAFVLAPFESGVIRYNYRVHHSVTGFEGQHYEHFEIYLVNTDKLNTNTFTKAKYDNVYEDIVALF